MESFKKLKENERLFFDKYFWTKGAGSSDYWGNEESSPIQVQPFLHRTKKFYWEKAYLEYLKQQTFADKTAQFAEVTMDTVYTVGNAFNAAAPALKLMLQFSPFLGIAWNLIDTVGALFLAIRDESKQDYWAQGINLLSGLQLTAGTWLFIVLNYGEILQVQLGISSSILIPGISMGAVIGTGASSFAFAAAMYFAWALEHREVKLHQARINYLETKIQELESILFFKDIDKNYGKSAEEKITYLQDFIAKNKNPESEITEYKNLLELLNFRQHQQQQLEVHERARRVWGFCAVFMTAVAIVSVVVVALGLSVVTCGIIMAVASSTALIGSALYRHKPEIFDNATRAIKSNIHSFFKAQSSSQQALDPVPAAVFPGATI